MYSQGRSLTMNGSSQQTQTVAIAILAFEIGQPEG
jgi:hypothetical protein